MFAIKEHVQIFRKSFSIIARALEFSQKDDQVFKKMLTQHIANKVTLQGLCWFSILSSSCNMIDGIHRYIRTFIGKEKIGVRGKGYYSETKLNTLPHLCVFVIFIALICHHSIDGF